MKPKLERVDTRTRIIEAAKQLFAEQGFQKATISEIAKVAGLSDAAIYEYFQGKEDLLLSLPDLWVKEAIEELESQLFGIKGAFNKLRKFLWWYLRDIEQDPLTSKVVFLNLKTNPNFLEKDVYQDVRAFYGILIPIFEEGRETGEMRKDLNPYAARALLLGTIEHMVIRWLLKGQSYSLFDNLEDTFQMLVGAFRADVPSTRP